MSELIEARSLANTVILAYLLHDSKKCDHVRACAQRLADRAGKANKPYLLDITKMNNKDIHITIRYLINREYNI